MTSYNADTEASQVLKDLGARVAGKTIVITGGSESSIGAEVAKDLAAANVKHLILAGRNEARIQPVIDAIKNANSAVRVDLVKLDLLDNASVRNAALEVKRLAPKIDILITSAGRMAVKEFVKSKDGIESQLAANHAGHFLFVNLLVPELYATAPTSRVVVVASLAYHLGEIRFDDYNFQDGKEYSRWLAYGQAKTASLLFAARLAKRLKKLRITVFAPHPGVTPTTKLVANAQIDQAGWVEVHKLAIERNGGQPPPPQAEKTLSQASASVLVAALDPSLRPKDSGKLIVENQFCEAEPYARGEENAERLWQLSEKLVGQSFKDF